MCHLVLRVLNLCMLLLQELSADRFETSLLLLVWFEYFHVISDFHLSGVYSVIDRVSLLSGFFFCIT